jgi:hypothetical protein
MSNAYLVAHIPNQTNNKQHKKNQRKNGSKVLSFADQLQAKGMEKMYIALF